LGLFTKIDGLVVDVVDACDGLDLRQLVWRDLRDRLREVRLVALQRRTAESKTGGANVMTFLLFSTMPVNYYFLVHTLTI
jgi:hypothetical protein